MKESTAYQGRISAPCPTCAALKARLEHNDWEGKLWLFEVAAEDERFEYILREGEQNERYINRQPES